jgi:hypothetical protein
VTPRGARLTLRDKSADVSVTTTYEGRSLDAILAAYPALKEKPGVASVVEQARKAEDEAKRTPPAPSWPEGARSHGVAIQVSPGHAKVTITEAGPDGKPVSKTYEGKTLEEIKREHPEVAEKLGGVRLHTGPEVEGDGAERGEFKWGPSRPMPGAPPQTGPFGLRIRALDDEQRSALGLTEGQGAVVEVVRPESDAAKAGLREGDVIVSVNGKTVDWREESASLPSLIQAAKDGALSFEVRREGKTLTLRR